MKVSKKILGIGIAVVLFLNIGIHANALDYGDEWSSYTGAETTKYVDVPQNHWAYDAIMRTSSKNWFSGYPDGSFMPDASITRAEALTVFVTFLGLELSNVNTTSFYDVDANEWYAPYIEAGKDLFPVHTTIQGKSPFNPNMPVTREDTIYALVKSLGCNLTEKYVDQSVLNMFVDKNSISESIKPYFSIALNHELVSGYPDGTIHAQDPLTRAEFATLLLRGTEHGFHDKYVAKIQSVTVIPSSPIELEVGNSITLSAQALYTDETSRSYDDIMPYDASGNGVISLSGNIITALKEGGATVKYNGEYLSNESTVITVKRSSSSPKIKITDYPDKTSEKSVVISGEVSDDSGADIELTCNGKDINIDSNGSFYAEVSLKDGQNNIEFIAKNKYGNKSSKMISVEKDSSAESPVFNCTFKNMNAYLDTSWGDDEFFLSFDFNCDVDAVSCGITCWNKATGKEISYCDSKQKNAAGTSGGYRGCQGWIDSSSTSGNGEAGLTLGETYEWKGYVIDRYGNKYESDICEFTFTDNGSRFAAQKTRQETQSEQQKESPSSFASAVEYYDSSKIPTYESITGASVSKSLSGEYVAPMSYSDNYANYVIYFYDSNEQQKNAYEEYLLNTGWVLNKTATDSDTRGTAVKSGYYLKNSVGTTIAQLVVTYIADCDDVDIQTVLPINQ